VGYDVDWGGGGGHGWIIMLQRTRKYPSKRAWHPLLLKLKLNLSARKKDIFCFSRVI
jgi:hypothetical protein